MAHGQKHLFVLLMQAEGNLAGPEDLSASSLDYFSQLTQWSAHPRMHQLFGLAEWMLQPVHGNRPTVREVLVELRAMSAQNRDTHLLTSN